MGATASVNDLGISKLDLSKTVILCHSSNVNQTQEKFQLPVITELSNVFTTELVGLIAQSESFVVFLDYNAQISLSFLDILSHVKNCRKIIYATKFDSYFNPTGGIAAICKTCGHWFETVESLLRTLSLESFSEQLHKMLNFAYSEHSSSPSDLQSTTVASIHDVCISYAPNSEAGASLAQIVSTLRVDRVTPPLQFPPSIHLSCSDIEADNLIIATSRVVMFVITPETLTSNEQMGHMRTAIRLGKFVLPIKASNLWLTEWIAVTLAGKIYFEVDLERTQDLYSTFQGIAGSMVRMHDSTPAIEIIRSVKGMVSMSKKMRRTPSEVQKEVIRRVAESAIHGGVSQDVVDSIVQSGKAAAEAIMSTEDLVEVTTQLTTTTSDTPSPTVISFPSVSSLLPEVQTLGMANIHYVKTRMGYPDPLDIRDEFGLPVASMQLDAMISYEWHSQAAILDLYQQFSSARVWLDVLGNMQGNMNTAMAEAVESVACVLVFVSEKYQNSMNCRLELNYAVACNKPLIFLLLEGADTLIQPWLREIMGECDVYPLQPDTTSQHPTAKYVVLDYKSECLHGIPMASAISGIVLKYVAWRALLPVTPCRDSTKRVFEITSQLIIAQQQAEKENDKLNITCTRCAVRYNPAAPYDGKCRKHSAFYVGGTLIAGRWVCCNAVEKNGAGCCVADNHMSVNREWYGHNTHTWKPE